MLKQRWVRVKRRLFIGLLMVLCCFASSCSLVLAEQGTLGTKEAASLLSSMDFTKIPVDYPDTWRENYRLPESFHLVEAEVYERDCTVVIYSARFIADEAEDVTIKNIYAYINALGWTIIQRTKGRSDAVSISARDLDGDGSCMMVVSADPDSGTRVMLSLNP